MSREELPPNLRDLSSLFFAIHIVGGHIGLPIVAATFAFSKAAKRHPTVINFCVTWILYSVIYCLLLYGGDNLLDDPPYALCLTQAALNYAAPPMAAMAGLLLVLQVWMTFLEPWKEARLASIPCGLKTCAIIAPPYITFVGFAASAAYVGWKNPHSVQVKTGLYCGLVHGRFEMLAVPIFCSIILSLIVGFEVATVVRIYRGRQLIKKNFPLATPRKPQLSPACRAASFLLYALLTLGACIMDIKGRSTVGYMIQASLPLAAFLIFGLSKDVLLTWIFWGCKRRWMPEESTTWNTIPNPRTISQNPDMHPVRRSLSFISATSETTIDSRTPITARPLDSVV